MKNKLNLKVKNFNSCAHSPSIFFITNGAFGPCNDRGDTSGSDSFTSKLVEAAIPLHHNKTSLSAIDSQK